MNIGWYSYSINPWCDNRMKMWTHHSDIIELINKEIPLSIYTLMTPTGNRKLNNFVLGDKTVLVEGYRYTDFHICDSTDFSYLDSLDVLFLEPGRAAFFEFCTSDYQKSLIELLEKKIKYLMERNVPILWFDGDGDLYLNKQGGEAYAISLYNRLNFKDYSNLTVVGTYEIGKEKQSPFVEIRNFKFVPYNANFDKFKEISPVSNRNIFSCYVGNNFRRGNFIEKFNNLSNYGEVKIIGKNWDEERFSNNVKLDSNGLLTTCFDDIYQVYCNSILGLYGTFEKGYQIKHYTLRLMEYLYSGVYVIPENMPYLVEKFPKGNLTIDDIGSEDFDKKLEFVTNNYSELVREQRDCLKPFFDSNILKEIYLKAFGC